jgi:hypothetical protein
VCSVLPLASASGPIYIGVVVVPAVLFLWWLLRAEAREGAEEEANAEIQRTGEDGAVEIDEGDCLSAP